MIYKNEVVIYPRMDSVTTIQNAESGLYTDKLDSLICLIKSTPTGHIQVEAGYGDYTDVESLAWEICSAVPSHTFEFYITKYLFGIKWLGQNDLTA